MYLIFQKIAKMYQFHEKLSVFVHYQAFSRKVQCRCTPCIKRLAPPLWDDALHIGTHIFRFSFLIIQLFKSISMDCFLSLELQCCFNEYLQIQMLINFFYRFRFINLTTTITLQLGFSYAQIYCWRTYKTSNLWLPIFESMMHDELLHPPRRPSLPSSSHCCSL